ncbi:MAG: hypothetical protein FWH02_08620 [Oscillospiraceae bacterium]|nr:hypothetical protein [Oscillospiraceae bacterium]
METNIPDSVRNPQNLSPVSGLWEVLHDKTFMSFSNTSQPIGRVTYRARGCEQLTVGIYNNPGTFAHPLPGGGWGLGVQADSAVLSVRPAGSQQAYFSLSNQFVYFPVSGTMRLAVYDSSMVFTDPAPEGFPEAPENGGMIGYGVNVYVSATGAAYTRVPLQPGIMYYVSNSLYCYEEFTASIPPGTAFIQVEINDTPRYYDMYDRARYNKLIRMTSLAKVILTGASLETGDPPPPPEAVPYLPPPEPPPPEPPAPKISGSQQQPPPADNASPAPAPEPKKDPDPPPQNEKKFEGVISSGGSTAPRPAPRDTQEKDEPDPPERSPAGQDSTVNSAPDTVIYQSPGNQSNGDGFSAGVIAYIAAVAAIILFVLLKPK